MGMQAYPTNNIQNDIAVLFPGFGIVSDEDKNTILKEARELSDRAGFDFLDVLQAMSDMLQSKIKPEDVLQLTRNSMAFTKDRAEFPNLDEYIKPPLNREQRRRQQRENRKKGNKNGGTNQQ